VAQDCDSQTSRELEGLQRRIAALESVNATCTEPLIGVNGDETIGIWNRAAQGLLGYTAREIVGTPLTRIIPESCVLAERRRMALVRQDNDSIEYEAKRIHKDGTPIEVHVVLTPVRDRQGQCVGLTMALRHLSRVPGLGSELQSRDLLRLIVDAIPLGVFWKDKNLVYLGCNARAARDAGLDRPEQIVGMRDQELAWSALADDYQSDDRAVLEAGEPKLNYSEQLVRPDGSVIHVSTCKVPLRDSEGNVFGLLGTYEDVTASREARDALRRSEERFALAMRSANDGLWDYDLQNGKVFFSARLRAMLGDGVQEWAESMEELTKHVHPDDAMRVRHTMDRYLEGSESRFEIDCRVLHRDGKYRSVLARGFAVRAAKHEKPTRFIGTLVDVTELKAAQASLGAAVQELKRSNEELEQFAYVASHDLQEPLRMVASFTQLLADRYRGKLDEKADMYIGYAVDGARRMQSLINDLLTLSRVGTQGISRTLVDCREVVADVRRHFGVSFEEQQACLSVEALPTVLGDRTQLMQLFQNLIGNALKFRGQDPPRIEVSAQRKESHYEFRVKDNGIGIDPAYAERIFVIFQRLHERGRYAGSGIGLALAKKIVERHGGRIWVESRLGEGATFVFTIPYPEMDRGEPCQST